MKSAITTRTCRLTTVHAVPIMTCPPSVARRDDPKTSATTRSPTDLRQPYAGGRPKATHSPKRVSRRPAHVERRHDADPYCRQIKPGGKRTGVRHRRALALRERRFRIDGRASGEVAVVVGNRGQMNTSRRRPLVKAEV